MINSYGLLNSFDSENVKVIDRFTSDKKYCLIYSNGRVVYRNGEEEKIIHIDTLYSTSVGFVNANDNVVRIYTCILGVVKIYLIEDNDVLTINLPSKLYHIRNKCVKFFNDTYYVIAGVQTNINTPEIIEGVENFSIETITLNEIKYAIINNGLFMSKVVETFGAENNVGRSFNYLQIFAKYDVIDFAINSSLTVVICRDGTILYNDSLTTIINTGLVKCTYDPSIIIKMSDPNLSINISDITTFKIVDSYSDINSNLRNTKMRFFKKCPNGRTRYVDIFDDNSAIVHYSDSDNFSNKEFIYLNNVSFTSDYYTVDSTFNNPDRVTFSKDGSKIVISRGKYGIVFVEENSYRYIYKDIGFKSDCEVKMGLFGDDGFLYIVLRKNGYVLRNSVKGKYDKFFDIVATSMIITDGQMDTNTEVSNIVSIDDELLFYCTGKHPLISNPLTGYESTTFFSNSGLYHYNSTTTKLTRVELLPENFQINNRRIFSVEKNFIIHEENFVLAKIDRVTFVKTYFIYTQISDCRVWEIMYNRGRYIFNIAISIDGINFTNNIMSFNGTTVENNLQLGVSDSTKNIPQSVKIQNFLPYKTACKAIGLYSIILFRDSLQTMTIYSIDLSGNVSKRNITFASNISVESEFNVKEFSNYIEFYIDKLPNFYEPRTIWRYYPKDNKLEVGSISNFDFTDASLTDNIICKSLSKTNLRVSEGFIFGDNSISDFGSDNVRFNDFTEIATRSFLTENLITSPISKYKDRISGEEITISNICSLKPNYLFVAPIGISRDDCKVYLAYNNIGDLRCVWEYSTNNNDIVDIFVHSETPNVNNIVGYELLGTPSPGNTALNNVDKWFIGEINNSVVGVIFKRDGGNNKLEYIDTIVYIGVKDKYVIKPTGLDNVKLPSFFFHVFDDTLTDIKIYCKSFGQKIVSINKTSTNIIDIFSRSNPENYISRDFKTIISNNADIKHERYFRNKTSIVSVNGVKQIRYIQNPLLMSISSIEPFSSPNLNISRGDDGYFTCSMVKGPLSRTSFLNIKEEFQGISRLVLLLDFDKDFGNLKDDPLNFYAVNGFTFSPDNGVTHIPIEFIKDPKNAFGFYSIINVEGYNLFNSEIYISNNNCNTNTCRFKVFATIMNNVDIVRSPIGPAACSNFNGITNIQPYGYSYDNLRINYSNGLIPRSIHNNYLLFPNNSTINFKFTFVGWFACDVFEMFSIDNIILRMQIASVLGDSVLVNCVLSNSSIAPLSFTYDKNFPIGCKIKRIDNKISIKLIQNNSLLTEFNDISITDQLSTKYCSLFDFYFGDINYLSIVDDTIDYSSNTIVEYLSDNVYGNIASLIRDYESGLLKAIVSPSSSGIIRDSGILEYSLSNTESVFSKKWTTKIVNDLTFGEIGIAENSAFTLISYQNNNGDYVNIFKRKTIEAMPTIEPGYIESVGGDNIVNMDGNKIITMEMFRI